MNYKKPKRIFEDSGTVVPEMSYHIELENVVFLQHRLLNLPGLNSMILRHSR